LLFGSWLVAGRLTRVPIGAGEEEQKSVYVSKLGELKALVQPVQTRAQEWSELPAAEEALRTTIMRFRKVVDLHNAKVWMAPMPCPAGLAMIAWSHRQSGNTRVLLWWLTSVTANTGREV
jgi:hypothetical protein